MTQIIDSECTVRIPTIELISNGVVTETASFTYLDILENYYSKFYSSPKILDCRIVLEQLQLNYKIKSLFRSVRYLDQSPTVVQSNAEKIANVLNFENDYRVDTGHAIELTIFDTDGVRRTLISYYNFGLNNNQADLITPYLTVNDVDIASRDDGLIFQIKTPESITNFLTTDYMTITGCFIFRGKIQYDTIL
ncbi:MAG: hypothetical protein AAFO04_25435 [Cyanobacteria bacterium J06592_8]